MIPKNISLFFKINHFKNESVFTTGLYIGLLSKIKVLAFPGLECCSQLNVEGFLQRSFLLAALLSGSNSRGKHGVRRGYDPLIGVLVPFGLPFGCFIAECGSSHKQKDRGFSLMLICPIWVVASSLVR